MIPHRSNHSLSYKTIQFLLSLIFQYVRHCFCLMKSWLCFTITCMSAVIPWNVPSSERKKLAWEEVHHLQQLAVVILYLSPCDTLGEWFFAKSSVRRWVCWCEVLLLFLALDFLPQQTLACVPSCDSNNILSLWIDNVLIASLQITRGLSQMSNHDIYIHHTRLPVYFLNLNIYVHN